jgi:N-methylhydantoinase B
VKPDPVQIEVYHQLFASIAEEMGAVLRRTACSPNIKERRDYSCALFDRAGRMIAQGENIPVHLGSMPASVAAALREVTPRRGDVVILNDPFRGGTHLPDVTMVASFFAADDAPLFHVANRAHHADIGGSAPGSMPLARDLIQEGLVIPPVLWVRGGKPVEETRRLLLANVRTPEEREGDLAAQEAALSVGLRRLSELVAHRGAGEVTAYATHLLERGARSMRQTLAAMPDGTWTFEDSVEDDGLGGGPYRIRARLTLAGEAAVVDFDGTSGPAVGGMNAVPAIAHSAVRYVFRCLLPAGTVANDGCWEPIEVRLPAGSLLDPPPLSAVAAGNVETSQRIVDVLLGALAQALPDRIAAASQGTMNNLALGGTDPRTGEPFAYYETIGGGHGGRPDGPGMSGRHSHMTNSLNTPVEVLEHDLPLRVEQYAIRRRRPAPRRRRPRPRVSIPRADRGDDAQRAAPHRAVGAARRRGRGTRPERAPSRRRGGADSAAVQVQPRDEARRPARRRDAGWRRLGEGMRRERVLVTLGALWLAAGVALLCARWVASWFTAGRHVPFGTMGMAVTVAAGALAIIWGALTIRFRTREWVASGNLLAFSLLVLTPLIAEAGLRLGIGLGIAKFRQAGLYADPDADDDYWKLHLLWNRDEQADVAGQVDPDLGWAPARTPGNPLGILASGPYNLDYAGQVVLFYGDSFVAGSHFLGPDERVTDYLAPLLPGETVYNYGGAGYGVDQIFLRFRLSHRLFQHPRILFGLLTTDLDRSVLTVRSGPKPYFVIENGALALRGVPITQRPDAWLAGHPPGIRSYLLAYLRRQYRVVSGGGDLDELPYRRRDKEEINSLILEGVVREARARDLPLTFLVFHDPRGFDRDGWRERFLSAEFERLKVEAIWVRDLVRQRSRRDGVPIEEYFFTDGHPNARGNRAVAEALAERIRGGGV